jgi:hypothetical protein
MGQTAWASKGRDERPQRGASNKKTSGAAADWATGAASMREFCDLSMPILLFGKDGSYIATTLDEVRWGQGD